MQKLYTFTTGIGGRLYAVFNPQVCAYDHKDLFPDCRLVCCGGFENAFDITHWAWGN